MSKELEIIDQFFYDGIISNNNKNKIDKILADEIELLINKLQTINFDNGTIVVSGSLTTNGGNIQFYELTNIEDEEKGIVDFNIKNNIFKTMSGKEYGLLIEPENYKVIEPYNRQNPYYLPYSYKSLTKLHIGKFNLYTVNKADFIQHTCKRLDKFDFNSYWNQVDFDMLILKENLGIFFKSLLTLCGMEDLIETVINYIK